MISKRHSAISTALALSAALATQVPMAAQSAGDGRGHLPRWVLLGTGAGDRAGHAVAIDGTTAATAGHRAVTPPTSTSASGAFGRSS